MKPSATGRGSLGLRLHEHEARGTKLLLFLTLSMHGGIIGANAAVRRNLERPRLLLRCRSNKPSAATRTSIRAAFCVSDVLPVSPTVSPREVKCPSLIGGAQPAPAVTRTAPFRVEGVPVGPLLAKRSTATARRVKSLQAISDFKVLELPNAPRPDVDARRVAAGCRDD